MNQQHTQVYIMKIETVDVLSLETIAEELSKIDSLTDVYRETGIQWITLKKLSEGRTPTPSFKNVTTLSDYLINRKDQELEQLELEAVMDKARELVAENRAKSQSQKGMINE